MIYNYSIGGTPNSSSVHSEESGYSKSPYKDTNHTINKFYYKIIPYYVGNTYK